MGTDIPCGLDSERQLGGWRGGGGERRNCFGEFPYGCTERPNVDLERIVGATVW